MEELLTNGELTEEQYNAVINDNNEVLCLACAGSGKSRTLAFRIARLIMEGNPPESIVAFTFTEKAAESLKRRVASALTKCSIPTAMVGAMYIGTIHSYCQNLLGIMDARYRQFEVLDENGFKLFLLSRYYELDIKSLRDSRGAGMFATIAELSRAFSIANDELLDFDEIEREDAILGACLKLIKARLNQDQYIDFSSMIRSVVEAIDDGREEVSKSLDQVKHLMVDEYQDVNPSQEALISGMYQHLETLFVVGDDDQSIYGWRGADVRNIIEFDLRYPDCSKLTLSTNFRSTEAIVMSSNQFVQMELSTSRIDKSPISHSDGNLSQFSNVWFESQQAEADWVAEKIESMLGLKYIEGDGSERGLTHADFAILMRSVQGGTRNGGNPHHRIYTSALQRRGIKYIIEAEGSIFERPHAFVIREAMGLLRTSGAQRSTVIDFFKDEVLPIYPNAQREEFLNVLSEWNNQIHTPVGGARRKVYPQKLVHDLIEAFRVSTTDFENKEQVLRDLGVFSSIILDVEKVFVSIDSSFRYQMVLNFLQNVAESGYDTSQVELMSRPDAVTVSTVHKMKGLEFPVVFIVDVVNLRFPGSNRRYNGWLPENLLSQTLSKGLYQTNNSGEARLFYTALTRAERFLYVTGGAYHEGIKNPKKPSKYKLRLSEMENLPITDVTSIEIDGAEEMDQIPRIDDTSMPTSFTEIKDYLECPMKYKYRKIYGFSPAVPELFGFGLTTHTAINRLHQLFETAAPTRGQAEDVTDETFHLKHVFKANQEGAEGPYERAKEASKRLVGEYANDYSEDFIQSRSLEQRFEISAGQALITGSIDLLLREDGEGNILDAKVIDFKSMDYPEHQQNSFFWINLALQVQLYAHASTVVLDENAKTGAVHLLKETNTPERPNRFEVPISKTAIEAALNNVTWAVDRILEGDFPMRPSIGKCSDCDFQQICSKQMEEFRGDTRPSAIHIPKVRGEISIEPRCFSDIN